MPDASYVQYSYDNAHRLWKINDGLGNRIEYTLDNMGNRVAEAAYDTGNTIVRAHTRVMDALNRLFKDLPSSWPQLFIFKTKSDSASLNPDRRTNGFKSWQNTLLH